MMISQDYPLHLKIYFWMMNNCVFLIALISLALSCLIAFSSELFKVQIIIKPSNFSDFTIALHALYIGSYLYILDLFSNNPSFKKLMGDEWKAARQGIQHRYFYAMFLNMILMLFLLFSAFKGSEWEIQNILCKVSFSFVIIAVSLFLIPIFLSVYNFGKRALNLDLG
jgi:hypothetical protein